MQYLGGKQRLAKLFAPVLDEALALGSGRLIEPFVGGFNILPSLAYARSALCADIHPGLIALYQALQSKVYVPPENLSEDRYQQLRLSSNWDDPNTAFAAFGCSFGGKEWGGYARNAKGDNYALRARKSLLKKAKSMQGVEFLHTNYRTLWVIMETWCMPIPLTQIQRATPRAASITMNFTSGASSDPERGPGYSCRSLQFLIDAVGP